MALGGGGAPQPWQHLDTLSRQPKWGATWLRHSEHWAGLPRHFVSRPPTQQALSKHGGPLEVLAENKGGEGTGPAVGVASRCGCLAGQHAPPGEAMLGLDGAPTLSPDLADLSPLTSHRPQGLVHTPGGGRRRPLL